MSDSSYKLYLWREALCDHTCGVMFAIAKSKEEAKEIVKKAFLDEHTYPLPKYYLVDEEPEVIPLNQPFGFTRYGGG